MFSFTSFLFNAWYEIPELVSSCACSIVFFIADAEAPQVSCPSNISSSTDPGENTTTVTWTNVTAADNADPNPELGCAPESGGQFSIGVTEVECEAIDSSGNKAACQFTVNVIGMFYNLQVAWLRPCSTC